MSVPNFRSPQRLAAHANRTGSHFFSPGTMRFFRSILHDAMRSADGTHYVIVSNQYEDIRGDLEERFYRIVRVTPGEQSTEVEYLDMDASYDTYDEAVAALAEVEL